MPDGGSVHATICGTRRLQRLLDRLPKSCVLMKCFISVLRAWNAPRRRRRRALGTTETWCICTRSQQAVSRREPERPGLNSALDVDLSGSRPRCKVIAGLCQTWQESYCHVVSCRCGYAIRPQSGDRLGGSYGDGLAPAKCS